MNNQIFARRTLFINLLYTQRDENIKSQIKVALSQCRSFGCGFISVKVGWFKGYRWRDTDTNSEIYDGENHLDRRCEKSGSTWSQGRKKFHTYNKLNWSHVAYEPSYKTRH